MGRAEQDVPGARLNERTGRFAVAGRDAPRIAVRQVQLVDLIERVSRLTLALKDHAGAVGREIAFSSARPLKRQPPRPRQKITLGNVLCGDGPRAD